METARWVGLEENLGKDGIWGRLTCLTSTSWSLLSFRKPLPRVGETSAALHVKPAGGRGRGQGQQPHLHYLQVLSFWICQGNPWLKWPTSCWTGLSSRGRSSQMTKKICSGSCCWKHRRPCLLGLTLRPQGLPPQPALP